MYVRLAISAYFADTYIIVAVVVARAFTNSQSSDAHLILFRRIYEIASQDSGSSVHLHHIHGSGNKTVVADAHRGQALGTQFVK